MRQVVIAAIAVLLLVCSTHAAPVPAHHLKVTLGKDDLRIERATPGGTVLVVGHELGARDHQRVQTRVIRQQIAGSDGTVSLSVGREIAPISFWVAFDLASGSHGATAAPRHSIREAEIPPHFFDGNTAKLAVPYEYVYALLVRPGMGVWDLTAADGGPADDDGAVFGRIGIATSKMRPRNDTAGDPGELRKGDVVAVFVPGQMAYLLTEVRK